MRELADTIQFYVLAWCAVSSAILIAAYIVALWIKAFRIWRHTYHDATLMLMTAWSLYVGGTKPVRPSITWDEGLYDAGSSISTNDLHEITIKWRDEIGMPSPHIVMPFGTHVWLVFAKHSARYTPFVFMTG